MKLSQALRLENSPCIAAVGAGGKSTALFRLARELPSPVVVTATTHFHRDQISLADSHHFVDTEESFDFLGKLSHGVTLVTGSLEGNRTTGLSDKLIKQLFEHTQTLQVPLLIEADGSRQKPLKAPADYEPVIPEFVDTVLVVMGMQCWRKLLSEKYVHRSGIFSRLTGLDMNEYISEEALSNFLTHPEGGLKGIPDTARRAVLLNQADSSGLISIAKKIALRCLPTFDSVITASFSRERKSTDLDCDVYSVQEPVLGVILAAGEAKRFGRLKQLVPWGGKPLIRHIVEIALGSNLTELILVTGAGGDEVAKAVCDLPVKIVANPSWKNGLGSSIQTGMMALPLNSGAVIFILADQPFLTPSILNTLIDRHSLELSPIVMPQVSGQRTNPVLFDRVTFTDLRALNGDAGGKTLFSSYNNILVPWDEESLTYEIDTQDDYHRLIAHNSNKSTGKKDSP